MCLLIHNNQLVSILLKCQDSEPSPFPDDTQTIAVHSALRLIVNPLHVRWIKGHANLVGNGISAQFSKWAAHSLILNLNLLPPPPLGQWRYTTCLSFINSQRSNSATYCRNIPMTT